MGPQSKQRVSLGIWTCSKLYHCFKVVLRKWEEEKRTSYPTLNMHSYSFVGYGWNVKWLPCIWNFLFIWPAAPFSGSAYEIMWVSHRKHTFNCHKVWVTTTVVLKWYVLLIGYYNNTKNCKSHWVCDSFFGQLPDWDHCFTPINVQYLMQYYFINV